MALSRLSVTLGNDNSNGLAQKHRCFHNELKDGYAFPFGHHTIVRIGWYRANVQCSGMVINLQYAIVELTISALGCWRVWVLALRSNTLSYTHCVVDMSRPFASYSENPFVMQMRVIVP